MDSNANPSYLTYLVPANDDTPEAVHYLLRLFKEAVLRGQQRREKAELGVESGDKEVEA